VSDAILNGDGFVSALWFLQTRLTGPYSRGYRVTSRTVKSNKHCLGLLAFIHEAAQLFQILLLRRSVYRAGTQGSGVYDYVAVQLTKTSTSSATYATFCRPPGCTAGSGGEKLSRLMAIIEYLDEMHQSLHFCRPTLRAAPGAGAGADSNCRDSSRSITCACSLFGARELRVRTKKRW
jgi:hypothetical protein